MNFVKAFFGGSKKATAVLGGALVLVLRNYLGLDEQTAAELVKLILTYVGAQGLVDVGLAFAGHKEQ